MENGLSTGLLARAKLWICGMIVLYAVWVIGLPSDVLR